MVPREWSVVVVRLITWRMANGIPASLVGGEYSQDGKEAESGQNGAEVLWGREDRALKGAGIAAISATGSQPHS